MRSDVTSLLSDAEDGISPGCNRDSTGIHQATSSDWTFRRWFLKYCMREKRRRKSFDEMKSFESIGHLRQHFRGRVADILIKCSQIRIRPFSTRRVFSTIGACAVRRIEGMRGTCLEHKTVASWLFCFACALVMFLVCGSTVHSVVVLAVSTWPACYFSMFSVGFYKFTTTLHFVVWMWYFYKLCIICRARKPKFSPSFLNRGDTAVPCSAQRHQRSRSVCAIVMVVSCMVSCRTCQCVTVGIRGNGVPIVDCSSQAT